ncbi:MAG: septal ring lytic transglycosylase RlpA family protein [Treponema sp.]|nr:septal ring lytic transglycosylase RlpA family protein [Treponema sp.]
MKKYTLLLLFFSIAARLFAQNYYKTNVEASYYAEKFNGRQTANGEIFNMNDLTAAHKTLPFGTIVRVTNLETGKSVTVRINDRGPNVEGREIDVSKAAAIELGMLGSGLAKVNIEIIKEAPAKATSTNSAEPTKAASAITESVIETAAVVEQDSSEEQRWDIQLGAYSSHANAEEMAQKLLDAGFTNVAYQVSGKMTRVIIRDISTDQIKSTTDSLESAGFGQYLVRKRSASVVQVPNTSDGSL